MHIKTVLEEDKHSEILGDQAGNLINRVAACVELLRKGAVNYQLRTTLIPTMHTPEIKNRLVKEFKSDNYVLQEFRSGVTIETELSHKSFEI